MTLKNRYNAKKAKYYWASEILERKAWRHFRRQQEAEVIEYISTLNNDPAARGKPWEEHIHQLIETSGLEGILRTSRPMSNVNSSCGLDLQVSSTNLTI